MKKKIVLELDETNYPLVLRQYGLEGAKEAAIQMCLKQKREITAVNLYSCLSNLESGLSEMFPVREGPPIPVSELNVPYHEVVDEEDD